MVPDGLSARRINLLDRSVRHYRQHGDGSSVMDSLRGTPDNYRDHLDLSLHLLDVGTRHGPGARRLMERYAAWTRLGFLRKLPRRSAGTRRRGAPARCGQALRGASAAKCCGSSSQPRGRGAAGGGEIGRTRRLTRGSFLFLPRMELLPGRVDLSAMTWPLPDPAE